VSIVDGSTGLVDATAGVGNGPLAIAVDDSTSTAYVSNMGSGSGSTISVLGPTTSGIAPTIVAGGAPAGIAVDQATGGLLIASTYPNDLIMVADAAGAASRTGPNPPPGTATSSLHPGVLSFVTTPANLTFPAVTLDGTDQSTSASLPLDIGDNTGTGAGWNVTITSTQFSDGSATLPSSATSVDTAPSASCDVGASCTPATLSANVTYPLTIPAGSTAPTATRLYSAAAGSGMGDQTIAPDFTLAVPADAAAGAYASDWTLSLVSGP
jgi:DNA-binding beta-propeller fold protein YncE